MPAPKGNKYAEGKGRPTSFKDEYVEQAYKLCLLGHTDAELAQYFEVSEVTINAWKNAHPEFAEALRKGKWESDHAVIESLRKKAIGYTRKEIKYVEYQGEITEEVEVDKYYPPDTTAAIFWLKNRQPSKFRDKQEVDLAVTELPQIIIKRADSE